MKETQAELTTLQEKLGLIVPKPAPAPTPTPTPAHVETSAVAHAHAQPSLTQENVQTRVKQLKLKALEAKRAGDKAKALGFLSEAKTLEASFIAGRSSQPVSGASAAATAASAAASMVVAAAKAIDADEEHRVAQYEHLETLLAQQVNDCRQRALV
jgi:hypothetical protein